MFYDRILKNSKAKKYLKTYKDFLGGNHVIIDKESSNNRTYIAAL